MHDAPAKIVFASGSLSETDSSKIPERNHVNFFIVNYICEFCYSVVDVIVGYVYWGYTVI